VYVCPVAWVLASRTVSDTMALCSKSRAVMSMLSSGAAVKKPEETLGCVSNETLQAKVFLMTTVKVQADLYVLVASTM